MDYQQVYCYDFRLTVEPAPPAEPSRFMVGMRNAVALSLPLWGLIIWLVKLAFSPR
jgi:hypothetical protein